MCLCFAGRMECPYVFFVKWKWSCEVSRCIVVFKRLLLLSCFCILGCLYVRKHNFIKLHSLFLPSLLKLSEDTNFAPLIPLLLSLFFSSVTPLLTFSPSLSARVWRFLMLSVPGGNIRIWFCGCTMKYPDQVTFPFMLFGWLCSWAWSPQL